MDLKSAAKPFFPKRLISFAWKLRNALRTRHKRQCPICDYNGYFTSFGRPPRHDALCPQCGSLERHRLFWLWLSADFGKLNEPILHFAPEPILLGLLRTKYEDYVTSEFVASADLQLNIEDIALDDGSMKSIICFHILEHVDDRQALRELHRILDDDGRLICAVPIVEGWQNTYENDEIDGPAAREAHFGQRDHLRLYGRDFRDRLRAAGFSHIEEVTAEGRAVIDHGLWRGEKIFVCRKT